MEQELVLSLDAGNRDPDERADDEDDEDHGNQIEPNRLNPPPNSLVHWSRISL
jgi:hypothetical protein